MITNNNEENTQCHYLAVKAYQDYVEELHQTIADYFKP